MDTTVPKRTPVSEALAALTRAGEALNQAADCLADEPGFAEQHRLTREQAHKTKKLHAVVMARDFHRRLHDEDIAEERLFIARCVAEARAEEESLTPIQRYEREDPSYDDGANF